MTGTSKKGTTAEMGPYEAVDDYTTPPTFEKTREPRSKDEAKRKTIRHSIAVTNAFKDTDPITTTWS